MKFDRHSLENKLIDKAQNDPDFKRRLISNPKIVLEEELKVKLPDQLDINVLEETSEQFFLVLPLNAEQYPDVELSDNQLDMINAAGIVIDGGNGGSDGGGSNDGGGSGGGSNSGSGCYLDCGCDVYCDF